MSIGATLKRVAEISGGAVARIARANQLRAEFWHIYVLVYHPLVIVTKMMGESSRHCFSQGSFDMAAVTLDNNEIRTSGCSLDLVRWFLMTRGTPYSTINN